MEKLDGINPKRIEWCLRDHSISLGQCADDVDISINTLEKVMAGETGLTFAQLKKLGAYFGRTALFFLEAGPVKQDDVRSPEFRSLLNQKVEVSRAVKRVIQLAEWQREIYVELAGDLGAEDGGKFSPPSLQGVHPKLAAKKAREWLRGGANSFQSYRQLLEENGVLVFRTNGYAGKWQIPKENPILGFSLFDPSHPLIVVKKQRAEARQTFTLAHELGHILLHRMSSIDDESDLFSHRGKEAEANKFAGYFLVPDETLAEIDDDERPDHVAEFDSWLSKSRAALGVSTEVILLRLIDAGRLSQSKYQAYRSWIENRVVDDEDSGSRKFRHREPRHILGDRYVRVIFDALERNKISITKASKYLDDVKLSDLRELERFCANH